MINVLEPMAQHLDFIAFSVVAITAIVVDKARKIKNKLELDKINERLIIFNETFLEENRLNLVGDFEFARVSEEDEVEDKFKLFKSIVIIEPEVNKGYDMFYVTRRKGDREPRHRHKRSRELFVLLSGKMKVNRYNKCGNKTTSCILKEKMESCVIQNKVFHTLEYLEDCELIVIAHPPIFTRIGKIYARTIQTIKNHFHKS